MFIWEDMWPYFSCVCLSNYEFFLFLEMYFTFIYFTHLWSSTSAIVFSPRYLSFKLPPGLLLSRANTLDPVPSFLHQEEIRSISSSFYLLFNLSLILGFFTKARNKPSNSALKCSNMCARVPWHLCASTHACTGILEFSGKTHTFWGA